MSRSHQDQFIDEDEEEEVCPLCVEELDITDKNFRPCPCGYQICQFCYNNIKTTMNGLCPACRRQYKEENIQWKAVTQEEMLQHKQNLAQQAKKKAAAKQKEAQRREADNLSRKHLAGLRVRQKNLVYVTGMKPKVQGDKLIEVLRGTQYFGQYGEIVKIVVANPSKPQQSSVGLYVTFARNEDAASCIETMTDFYTDGSVRAQFGTTKYCSAYLRGETCNNRSCMFLHEPGDENERYTRQDLSLLNASSSQQPAATQPPPAQQSLPVAAATQDYGDSAISPTEAPALPATASWADSARRASRATTTSVPSPLITYPTPSTQQGSESRSTAKRKESQDASGENNSTPTASEASRTERKTSKSAAQASKAPYFDQILKSAFDPEVRFEFSAAHLSEKERDLIEHMPPLWDPQGGDKRRELRARQAEELRRQQEEIQSLPEIATLIPETEESAEGGSLQLGGEPEERLDRAFSHGSQSAIQPPQANLGGSAFALGTTQSLGDEFAAVGIGKRALTPQQHQQQQLLLQSLRSATNLPQTANQNFGVSSMNHGRQNSRFNFTESGTTTKPSSASNVPKQQATLLGQQQPINSQYFSNVQGPPPGLRATGTPPISGGGMFGQGHGFTQGVGYSSAGGRETDKIWDFHRGGQRGNVGGQVAEASKHDLPSLGQSQHERNASGASSSRPFGSPSRQATPSLPPGLPIPLGFKVPSNIQGPVSAVNERTEPAFSIKSANEQNILQGSAALQTDDKATVDETFPKQTLSARPIVANTTALSGNNQIPKDSPAKAKAVASSEALPEAEAYQTTVASKMTSKRTINDKGMGKTTSMSSIAALPAPVAAKNEEKGLDVPSGAVKGFVAAAQTTSASLKRTKPGILDLTDLSTANLVASAASATASPLALQATARVAGTPLETAISTARVEMPAAGAISSPIRRTTQPRTLRITSTAVVETLSVPTVSTPSLEMKVPAILGAGKLPSRRPSLSSTKPSTPISERVDGFSLGSASVSRASSPPPIVTNRKAERKKQKKQQPPIDAVVLEPPKPAEEVAPILARKKKTKKPGAGPVAKPGLGVAKDEPTEADEKEDAVLESKEEIRSPKAKGKNANAKKETIASPKRASKAETPPPPPPPTEKVLSAAAMLGVLESTHDLALSALALLKPLTSGKNMSWFQDATSAHFNSVDLQNHLQQLSFEISKAEKDLLKQGQAIRKDMGNSRVSGRNLLTPKGDRYACLTKEEEDRVLMYEQAIAESKGNTKWNGAKSRNAAIPKTALRVEGDPIEVLPPATASSTSNVKESRANQIPEDDVLRYNNAFIPPTASSDGTLVPNSSPRPSISTEISTAFDNSARETLAAVAAAAMNATAQIEGHLGLQPGELAGQAMSAAGLSFKEAERLLTEKRKETEAWEKKVNALVKKNRKAVLGGAAGGH